MYPKLKTDIDRMKETGEKQQEIKKQETDRISLTNKLTLGNQQTAKIIL